MRDLGLRGFEGLRHLGISGRGLGDSGVEGGSFKGVYRVALKVVFRGSFKGDL